MRALLFDDSGRRVVIYTSKGRLNPCERFADREAVSVQVIGNGFLANHGQIIVPNDYDERLSYYTHKGYRVIGCATRHLKKLSWVKAQKMTRSEVESDLEFVGFIIFENKLKPTTSDVLKELLDSNIGAVMVTGDNILTAISVARECGLVNRTAHCFVPRFAQGNLNNPLSKAYHANVVGDFRDPKAELQWESIDDSLYTLDKDTLLVCSLPTIPRTYPILYTYLT